MLGRQLDDIKAELDAYGDDDDDLLEEEQQRLRELTRQSTRTE